MCVCVCGPVTKEYVDCVKRDTVNLAFASTTGGCADRKIKNFFFKYLSSFIHIVNECDTGAFNYYANVVTPHSVTHPRSTTFFPSLSPTVSIGNFSFFFIINVIYLFLFVSE